MYEDSPYPKEMLSQDPQVNEFSTPSADSSSEEYQYAGDRAKAQNKKLKVIIKDYFMEKHNIDIR